MTFWRKIVFYILLFIYALTAPWLTLRMLGYVWHPAAFRLVKTGLVVINSTPSRANVYIDGKHAFYRTPVTVRELVPGDHFIRIEKEGFRDWVCHFAIASNKATVLGKIALAPLVPAL